MWLDSKSGWFVQVMPDGLICIGQERKLSVCHLWLGKHGRLIYSVFAQDIVLQSLRGLRGH